MGATLVLSAIVMKAVSDMLKIGMHFTRIMKARAMGALPGIILFGLAGSMEAEDRAARFGVGASVTVPTPARVATPVSANTQIKLPPAPDGVSDLKFSEFYHTPIGPRGFEYSNKIKLLDGKKVRILGYRVHSDASIDGVFILAPVPVHCHEDEMGLADDMPATTMHVHAKRQASQAMPFTPGLLLLTGTLSLGNQEEQDGRVSSVRLQLDSMSGVETISATAAPVLQNSSAVADQQTK